MRSSLALFCALVFLVLLPGCAPQLDLSNKPCPCAPGFFCVDDLCVPGLSGGDAGGPAGLIQITGLRSDWQTPNSLHWRWTLVGEQADFAELTLVIAENEEDLLAQTGTARVIDRTERASLGVYYRRRTSGEEDLVDSVFTDQHTPNTRYVAQMIATDSLGNTSRSNIAPATTTIAPLPGAGLVLFSDDRPRGYPLPEVPPVTLSTEAPHEGTHHIEYVQTECPGGEPLCFENIRWQDLRAGAPAFTGGSFGLAYLEMAVEIDAVEPSFWSEIGINLHVEGPDETWLFKPFVPRYGDGYHIIQVPLRVLDRGGESLTFEHLAARSVNGFRLGAIFPVRTRVRIDEVAIRW